MRLTRTFRPGTCRPCDPAPPETTRRPATARAADRSRRLPVGAELTPRVSISACGLGATADRSRLAQGLGHLPPSPLETEANGYSPGRSKRPRRYALLVSAGRRGRFGSGPGLRFQPEGPMGPSEVIDPDLFAWTKVHRLAGSSARRPVLYECPWALHAAGHLASGHRATARSCRARHHHHRDDARRRLHRTIGWGYDGVDLFAPTG